MAKDTKLKMFSEMTKNLIDFYSSLRTSTKDTSIEVLYEYYELVNNVFKNTNDIGYFVRYFGAWHICLLNKNWFDQIYLPFKVTYVTNPESENILIQFTYVKPEATFTKVVKTKGNQRNKYSDRDEVEETQPRKQPFNIFVSHDASTDIVQTYYNIHTQINKYIKDTNNEITNKTISTPKNINNILKAFNLEWISSPENHYKFILLLGSLKKYFLIYYFGFDISKKASESYNQYKIFYYSYGSDDAHWSCKVISDIPPGQTRIVFDFEVPPQDLYISQRNTEHYVRNRNNGKFNDRRFKRGNTNTNPNQRNNYTRYQETYVEQESTQYSDEAETEDVDEQTGQQSVVSMDE